MFRFPDFQNRHTGDGGVRIVLRRRVYDVVGANHNHHVGFREIGVEFVHLHHDVVRDFGFGQKHVHVARQATRYGVDTETHVLALGT